MPIKQLKVFKRITLGKGEKRTVSFTLWREEMSYWDSKNEFVLDAGEYNVLVGASSEDIRQTINFVVMK